MKALDYLFHILHLVVITINLFFWIPRKTRRIHLITIGLTIISWIGLGSIYGLGYCFLTDWQWDIKHTLGETNIPNSYLSYWFINILGLNISESTIENTTVWTLIGIIIATVIVNAKDIIKK